MRRKNSSFKENRSLSRRDAKIKEMKNFGNLYYDLKDKEAFAISNAEKLCEINEDKKENPATTFFRLVQELQNLGGYPLCET